MFFPSDKSYKYFSSFVFENDESTIKEVTSMIKDRMRAFRNQFSGQQGLLQVTPIHSGGKAGSPAANATAFPWRKDICYITYIMHSSISPEKILRRNQYEDAYYDVNVIKLQEVKAHWDRKNLFHFSQSNQLVSPEAGYAAGDSYRPATDEQLVHDQWESSTSTLPQTNDFPGIEGYPYSGF
ncbi:hypothetical protein F9C07_3480 [Aspergillus flavus]|uniref:Berberine/berberine-like domain-containing protein n=1 Tax=Aspergillus flavus (strain ATCC 200026 / FGSC A1120 / IAM 13836 / NRRL 3357 / JCM 12722 / SRRC 167) TaxID=332952 RepID=A0A7U2QZA6_ASPFN|nr:hypothetical protein F9C07_3480 [Aspergillus flavus]